MNTRRGLASCAVLVLLAVANVAAAQQPRERRQDRRAQPKPKATVTNLFEQTDVSYVVLHTVAGGAEFCQIMMGDKPAQTMFAIETNASDHTGVIVQNFSDPRPAPFRRFGATQSLRVEVDGVAQTYNIKTLEDEHGGAWAETLVPRANPP